jgi:hypothetical protein
LKRFFEIMENEKAINNSITDINDKYSNTENGYAI